MKPLTNIINILAFMLASMMIACVNNISEEKEKTEEPATAQISVENLLSTGFEQSTSLEQSFPSIEGAPSLSNQTLTLGKKSGLSKTSSAEEDVAIDSSNKDEGYILVVMTTSTTTYKKTDSIWVVWDEFARDEIEDNENIQKFFTSTQYISGKVEELRITDADGDGIVNGESKYALKAHLEFINLSALGVVEKSNMTVSSGEDKDFDTEEDNLMSAMKWERIFEDEVIAYAHFTDYDGDGILVDPGFSTNSRVQVEIYETANLLKPLVEFSKLNLIVEMSEAHKDGELIAISGEEKFKNGIHNKIIAQTNDGKEIIKGAQIVMVSLTSENPVSDDSSLHSEAVFAIDVGTGFSNEADNGILEIHLVREKKFGLIASEEFHFISDNPIREGEEPTKGSIDILVEFRDGKTASFTGTFDKGTAEGTLVGPEGNSISFKWEKK